MDREYSITASKQGGGRGCISRITVPDANPPTHARVTLSPRAAGGSVWCKGTFRGHISETARPICGGPAVACPQFILVDRNVGTFTFRVR
jgi:hypothetical protein